MARIPDAFIDDLLARTDIVEVVGSARAAEAPGQGILRRAARSTTSARPRSRSRPTKQFYHCFGCGAHGTAISFLMNYDRLEFLDAVDELAKPCGMEVPRDTQQRNASRTTAATCTAAMDAAARFFQTAAGGQRQGHAPIWTSAAWTRTTARGLRSAMRPTAISALKDALGTDARRHEAAGPRRPVVQERHAATSTTSSATG